MAAAAPVVAIGGGHGLARTLQALVGLGHRPTAVVSVADDGGSSGRLRRDHGIIAVGDMRMALLSMAADGEVARLFAHRFGAGDLHGHALGNLAILALAETHGGDFVEAIREAGELLGCHGRVIPCTTDDVTLVAAIDGVDVTGQVAIAQTPGHHWPVWLEPRDPAACPQAVAAIEAAPAIVLGPGSLFTSIIPNLLVSGIAQAIARAEGPVVYVANLTAQPGETADLDLQGHVDALLAHLPDGVGLDVIAHDGPAADGGGRPLVPPVRGPRVRGVRTADLALRRAEDGRPIAAHDPARLGEALAAFVGAPAEEAGRTARAAP